MFGVVLVLTTILVMNYNMNMNMNMNMNKIKTFLKKNWLFILLASLATVLAVFYFTKQETQIEKRRDLLSLKSPSIKTYSSSLPNLKQLEKNFPSFPKEIEVYQVDNNLISDQMALEIANSFGYQDGLVVTNDIKGPIYNWNTQLNSLTIYLQEGRFQYGLDLLRNPELVKGRPPSLEESEDKLNNFLKEKNLNPPEKINSKIIEKDYYLIGGSDFVKTNIDDPEKDLAFLKAIYQINEFKINGPENPFISVYLASNFQIARFDYSKIFKKINALDFYPLKTPQEIIKTMGDEPQISFLKNAESFYQEDLIYGEELPEVKNLLFNKIELIYYKEINQQTYLQPVFLITGTAILEDGTKAISGLYLPAIKDKYLLTP